MFGNLIKKKKEKDGETITLFFFFFFFSSPPCFHKLPATPNSFINLRVSAASYNTICESKKKKKKENLAEKRTMIG